MSRLTRISGNSFRPYKGMVFVTDLDRGPSITRGGLIIPDDNMSDRGIRARWGKVWAIADDIDDLEIGQWVLIEHGRWTERMTISLPEGDTEVWRIEHPKSTLVVSDEDPRQLHNTTLSAAKS